MESDEKIIVFLLIFLTTRIFSQVNIQNPQYDILDVLSYRCGIVSDTTDEIEVEAHIKLFFQEGY
ncbi:MAG: hypothetical protein R2771_09505 [Saprospiraceae bacterium]